VVRNCFLKMTQTTVSQMELVLHEWLPRNHPPFVELLATTRTTSGQLAKRV
jgi:hypothetical protein